MQMLHDMHFKPVRRMAPKPWNEMPRSMSHEDMDTYVERQRRQATADAAVLPSGKRSPLMNNVVGEGTAALNGLQLGERVLRFGPTQPASYPNVMHADV